MPSLRSSNPADHLRSYSLPPAKSGAAHVSIQRSLRGPPVPSLQDRNHSELTAPGPSRSPQLCLGGLYCKNTSDRPTSHEPVDDGSEHAQMVFAPGFAYGEKQKPELEQSDHHDSSLCVGTCQRVGRDRRCYPLVFWRSVAGRGDLFAWNERPFSLSSNPGGVD